MEKEIWKDIPNYEGFYQASNLGRIKRIQRNAKHPHSKIRLLKEKILIPYEQIPPGRRDGYLRTTLFNNGKSQKKFTHNLIAITFIDGKTSEKKFVNHIDGNKKNNTLSNLEWVTSSENINHAFENELRKRGFGKLFSNKSRAINQLTLNGEIIMSYPSINSAHELTKISKGNIGSVCRNMRQSAGGFRWQYANLKQIEPDVSKA